MSCKAKDPSQIGPNIKDKAWLSCENICPLYSHMDFHDDKILIAMRIRVVYPKKQSFNKKIYRIL